MKKINRRDFLKISALGGSAAALAACGADAVTEAPAAEVEAPALDLPFEVVVNTTSAELPIEASLRQQLLAEDDLIQRQHLAADYLSAVIDAISQLGATEDDGSSLVN